MLRVLRKKLADLVRGEDGVAMVVTLGVFFFLYLVIMGIYTVGMSVKERIHLQNACDAAAYSAAVAQADTLSRIATVNRAMSWTYVQMVRRQMDYVTRAWLGEVAEHWHDDYTNAVAWAAQSTAHCTTASHTSKKDYSVADITLTGATSVRTVTYDTLTTALTQYDQTTTNASFYASTGSGSGTLKDQMKNQIDVDRTTLADMNTALDDLVDAGLRSITNAAVEMARANLGDKTAQPLVVASALADYLQNLPSEDRFIRYGGETNVTKAFGASSAWFAQTASSGSGFARAFVDGYSGMCATWTWWSHKWTCSSDSYHRFTSAKCSHGGHYHCSCTSEESSYGTGTHIVNTASVNADNDKSKNAANATYYASTVTARPLVLTSDYFGSNGTITVGLQRTTTNIWSRIVGEIASGLYSAFEPYCRAAVVFSSAKAGYRTYAEGATRGRNYKIDWDNEESWNLYSSDWDAVLVPVRMAQSVATNGIWGAASDSFLANWVHALGVEDDDMRAGGTYEPKTNVVNDLSTSDRWRWYNASADRDYKEGPAVEAKWQIENNHAVPTWNRLTDRMFH